jgi:YbbR domain-containing protein
MLIQPQKNMIGTDVTEVLGTTRVSSGNYKDTFETSSLAEGVYFVIININGKQITKKMVIRK